MPDLTKGGQNKRDRDLKRPELRPGPQGSRSRAATGGGGAPLSDRAAKQLKRNIRTRSGKRPERPGRSSRRARGGDQGRNQEQSQRSDRLRAADALMQRLQVHSRRKRPIKRVVRQTFQQRLARRFGPSFFLGRVTDKDLMLFTRQFATMLNAGLPLVQSLSIQILQAPNPFFRAQLQVIKERVQAGATLAGALKRFPRTFDPLYVNLVHAGEMGGVLDEIMLRLAQYIEKASKLKRQIKAAMVYPSAIIVVAITVVILVLVKVVPVFERMFHGVGTEIPAPTQFLIDVSNLFKTNFIWIALATIAGITGIVTLYRLRPARSMLDRVILSLPVVGDLVVKVEVARFARTLTTMLTSGVSILESLEVCENSAENVHVRRAIAAARRGVTSGKVLGKQMVATGVFPNLVCQMITVGEATGALDRMLAKMAIFYEEEVESAVGAVVALIEPALMVFLGIIIGGILIAMYLPIFIMSSAVGHF